MSKRINKLMWLEAQEDATGIPMSGSQPEGIPVNTNPDQAQPKPMQQPQMQPSQPKQPDQNLEPVSPDIPENNESVEFTSWRDEFFKLAVQGDTNKMLDSINTIREQNLDAAQSKFVEDNYQICMLRQDANFDKVSKSIRKSIKTDLDREHPGISLIQIISPEIDNDPILSEIITKLYGYYGLKGELHRKFIAALTGSVQVGGGGNKEDLVFNDKDYSINISTRMSSSFGEITIGKWSLNANDPQQFLAEPELARLKEGSPEEKLALTHRIIIESMAEKFKTRAFIIHVVGDDGNSYSIGWDLGDSLKDAYRDGKLIVKSDISSDNDATIDESGQIIALKNLGIYAKLPGDVNDQTGQTEGKEVPFIENRSGTLFFVADLDTMNAIGGNLTGMVFNSKPYTGSPVEFKQLTQKVPGLGELLLRR